MQEVAGRFLPTWTNDRDIAIFYPKSGFSCVSKGCTGKTCRARNQPGRCFECAKFLLNLSDKAVETRCTMMNDIMGPLAYVQHWTEREKAARAEKFKMAYLAGEVDINGRPRNNKKSDKKKRETSELDSMAI